MDTFFFYISKIIWALISPDSLLLILILITLALLYLKNYLLAKKLLTAVSIILIVIAILPVGDWLLYPLESRFPANPALPDKIDGIIVLSGAEEPELSHLWGQIELGGSVERVLYFIALARQYPNAKLVFTGGSGSLSQQQYKGADVAKKLFEQQGFDTKKIIFERDSRNTYENIIFSKKIVLPNKNENWVLITTSWHMPRSVGLFCKADWPVIPYPVDHQLNKDHIYKFNFDLFSNMGGLKTSIKEWIGLSAYYLTGKTIAFFPEQCS